MTRLWIVFLCSLVVFCTCLAQDLDAATENQIDAFARKVLSCRELAGFNLAIVRRGKTVLTKGYGTANLKTNANMTATTLIGIASLTKAFTTTLLAKLLSKNSR